MLAAVTGDAGPWTAMLEELRTRRHPLLFFVEPPNRMGVVTWPGAGVGLPVFGDLRSLFQTAREMNRPPDSFAVGSLPGKELFAYSRDQRLALMLCVFLEDGQVKYLRLGPEHIAALV